MLTLSFDRKTISISAFETLSDGEKNIKLLLRPSLEKKVMTKITWMNSGTFSVGSVCNQQHQYRMLIRYSGVSWMHIGVFTGGKE
jgi:hypothetical protein